MFRRSAERLLVVYPMSGVVVCLLVAAMFVAVMIFGFPVSSGSEMYGAGEVFALCAGLLLAFFVPGWGGVAGVMGLWHMLVGRVYLRRWAGVGFGALHAAGSCGALILVSKSYDYWGLTPVVCTEVLVSAAVAALLLRFGVVTREESIGTCERCGYDLRATPDRCPECGTEVRR